MLWGAAAARVAANGGLSTLGLTLDIDCIWKFTTSWALYHLLDPTCISVSCCYYMFHFAAPGLWLWNIIPLRSNWLFMTLNYWSIKFDGLAFQVLLQTYSKSLYYCRIIAHCNVGHSENTCGYYMFNLGVPGISPLKYKSIVTFQSYLQMTLQNWLRYSSLPSWNHS